MKFREIRTGLNDLAGKYLGEWTTTEVTPKGLATIAAGGLAALGLTAVDTNNAYADGQSGVGVKVYSESGNSVSCQDVVNCLPPIPAQAKPKRSKPLPKSLWKKTFRSDIDANGRAIGVNAENIDGLQTLTSSMAAERRKLAGQVYGLQTDTASIAAAHRGLAGQVRGLQTDTSSHADVLRNQVRRISALDAVVGGHTLERSVLYEALENRMKPLQGKLDLEKAKCIDYLADLTNFAQHYGGNTLGAAAKLITDNENLTYFARGRALSTLLKTQESKTLLEEGLIAKLKGISDLPDNVYDGREKARMRIQLMDVYGQRHVELGQLSAVCSEAHADSYNTRKGDVEDIGTALDGEKRRAEQKSTFQTLFDLALIAGIEYNPGIGGVAGLGGARIGVNPTESFSLSVFGALMGGQAGTYTNPAKVEPLPDQKNGNFILTGEREINSSGEYSPAGLLGLTFGYNVLPGEEWSLDLGVGASVYFSKRTDNQNALSRTRLLAADGSELPNGISDPKESPERCEGGDTAPCTSESTGLTPAVSLSIGTRGSDGFGVKAYGGLAIPSNKEVAAVAGLRMEYDVVDVISYVAKK